MIRSRLTSPKFPDLSPFGTLRASEYEGGWNPSEGGTGDLDGDARYADDLGFGFGRLSMPPSKSAAGVAGEGVALGGI